jgi:cytochrome c oxidase subunit 2
MMDPLAKLAAGFPPVMPTYQGALAPADVAAIVELVRSLRDATPPHEELAPR